MIGRLKFWPQAFILFNGLILLLVILLAKDPFSGLNAISELEPSPDAIHYLSPVKSLYDGHGFAITYQGRSVPASVPPLYSLTLLPFYGLFHDPRVFYLLNVGLAILSTCLFYKLCQKMFHRPLIMWLTFGSFSTNFVLFWYSSFPMSENLLIFLTVMSFFLLIPPVTWKKAVGAGFLAVLMFATKYVAWVEGLSLMSSFLLMVGLTKERWFLKSKLAGLGIGTLVTGLLSTFFFESQINGTGVLTKVSSASNHFKNTPFGDNLIRYLFGLLGGELTVAGQGFSLVSPVVGFGAVIALLLLAWNNLTRFVFVYILLSILGSLLYLSAFETVDGRYFFAFIPGLTLLFGFSLESISGVLEKYHFNLAKKLFIGLIIISALCFSIPAIFQAIKTNFTHSDQSANFQTITVFNRYFDARDFPIKPTVITVLSPYQVDFFSNHTYGLLPLSKRQYFTMSETETWGIVAGQSYINEFKNRLSEGKPLFVSNYHTNPDFLFWNDFQKLGKNFRLVKVADGCNGQCDLYQIDSLDTKPTY